MNNNKETKTESKELFTGGEWEASVYMNEVSIYSSEGIGIAKLPFHLFPYFEEQVIANGNMLAASKDMYYAIKKTLPNIEARIKMHECNGENYEAEVFRYIVRILKAALSKALGNK